MMKKRISGRTLVLVIALVIGVLFAVGFIIADRIYDSSPENAVPKKMKVPDGVTYIRWSNKDGGKNSMEKLKACLTALEPSVAISKAEELEWKDICPENFWVKNFSVTTYDNANFKLYNFKYYPDASGNKKMSQEIEKASEDIISTVRKSSGGTQWEDILLVHDELIRRTEFVEDDEDGDHTHDIYGALVLKRAVCQGYTYAFSYILDKMGYSCSEIYSKEHIWTKVNSLETGERYIDVTWDDYNKNDRNGEPFIHHNFFCLTKAEMESFDEHTPENNEDKETLTTVGDNYYRKKNYYIKKGDEMGFRASALEQYQQGKNLLEFRFESKEDYEKAGDWMIAVLKELGYKEKSYYVYNKPELLTYCAGLYVAEEDKEQEKEQEKEQTA